MMITIVITRMAMMMKKMIRMMMIIAIIRMVTITKIV